jgi:hypothetical protein
MVFSRYCPEICLEVVGGMTRNLRITEASAEVRTEDLRNASPDPYPSNSSFDESESFSLCSRMCSYIISWKLLIKAS